MVKNPNGIGLRRAYADMKLHYSVRSARHFSDSKYANDTKAQKPVRVKPAHRTYSK